jgi:hypothetical protein
MHQIVLLTALTATSGLFGGGRHCRTGQCGTPAPAYHAYAPVSTCQPGTACAGSYAAPMAHRAPVYSAPQAPAPQTAYAPAPQATTYYPSFYSAPAATSCATGNCPRR